MKNRTWIIIFSSVVLLSLGLWFFISHLGSPSKIVGIYQNNTLIEKVDLSCIASEREIVLNGSFGSNVILLTNGHVRMKSAECPDKLCVKHGELLSSTSPIVCLPNKVIIKFESSFDEADAKTGAGV